MRRAGHHEQRCTNQGPEIGFIGDQNVRATISEKTHTIANFQGRFANSLMFSAPF